MKNTTPSSFIASVFALAAALLSSAPLHAQGTFPPTTGPTTPIMKSLAQVEPRIAIPAGGSYVISSPGSYYLTGNITTASGSTSGISITSNDVTLDLNGFTISGLNNPATVDFGIYAASGKSNISIRNGFIKQAAYGVYFSPGQASGGSLRVQEVNCHQIFSAGIFEGANVPSFLIYRCQIDTVGGATGGADSNGYGIYTLSNGRVEGCQVAGVKGSTINASTGNGRGLDLFSTTIAIGNTVINCDVGVGYAKCQNNLTAGCTTPFNAIIDAGGNN